MTPHSAVLAIIDVQNGFVNEYSKHVVPTIADLASRWQANGGDVIFTRYINYPGSPFERLIGYTELRSCPETQLIDELAVSAVHATCILDKGVYTLFTEAGAAIVRQHGWTDIYLFGIDTECCVLKTAVDAFERGFTPWVLTDACASHSGQNSHDAGLLVTSELIGTSQMITTPEVPHTLLPAPSPVS
jgi:nicotinamidase-related amidase